MLFGFQLRGAFEEGFEHLSALASIVLTATVLVAAPAQHRIVEQGDASVRLLRLTERLGLVALMFFALTLGCDGYIVSEYYFGSAIAAFAEVTTLGSPSWCGGDWGSISRKGAPRSAPLGRLRRGSFARASARAIPVKLHDGNACCVANRLRAIN